jgi:hypothetical protein
MNILIIPDVHGRGFWREPCSNIDKFDKVIFLGDYLDPYPNEGITPLIARDNLKEIIEFVNTHKDKCVCLYGNHDLHYTHPSYDAKARSTRYDFNGAKQNCELLKQLPLQIAYEYDNFLFTHAGVNIKWYDNNKSIIGELSAHNLNKLIDSEEGIELLAQIGRRRGGMYLTGSCVWNDVVDMVGKPWSNYIQVFGHTQLAHWVSTKTNLKAQFPNNEPFYCLDCRKAFTLQEHNIVEYPETD